MSIFYLVQYCTRSQGFKDQQILLLRKFIDFTAQWENSKTYKQQANMNNDWNKQITVTENNTHCASFCNLIAPTLILSGAICGSNSLIAG